MARSLYAMEDVKESPVSDNEWFTMHIRVERRDIQVNVDGEAVVDYTELDTPDHPDNMSSRVL